MKISDLTTCYQMIGSMDKNLKIPVAMSIVLSDNFRKIEPIMADAEKKRLEFSKEDYAKLMEELLNTDVEIALSKMTMDMLKTCDENPKYDALSITQISVIKDFMLSEE